MLFFPALQHIVQRPMALPTRVNLIADALIADVRAEPHAILTAIVLSGSVNHVAGVNHHIARFVIGH